MDNKILTSMFKNRNQLQKEKALTERKRRFDKENILIDNFDFELHPESEIMMKKQIRL